MGNYKTKHFGNVLINETAVFFNGPNMLIDDEASEKIELEFNGQKVIFRFTHFENVSLNHIAWCSAPELITEKNLKKDFIKECIEKMDKYSEIDKTTREFFIEWYPKDDVVRGYFHGLFDHITEERMLKTFGVKKLDESTVKVIVEKLDYPNICFDYDQGHIITCVDYKVSALYEGMFIGVEMDDSLDIISAGFSSF